MNPTVSEQERLLSDIRMVCFSVTELTLYLDTHPKDARALEYFNHYIRIQKQLEKEYAAKYGPLNLATANTYNGEWNWGRMPLPWEGVCGYVEL